jgi:hypothetical protein
VKNEEVLHTVKQEGNILDRIKRKKANRTGHFLVRNCVEGKIEGRIEVTENEKENTSSYWMTLRKREDIGN